MSGNTKDDTTHQENWPVWVKSFLKWLAIATAVVAAASAFLLAVGKLGDAYQVVCKGFGGCHTDTPANRAGPEAAPKPIPPSIPDADSGWIDGGSSPDKYCAPRLAAVRNQYPAFDIEMTILPEQHRSEYTPFKHDLYRYQCSFIAKSK